jgi:predicted metal-binding membrane protein
MSLWTAAKSKGGSLETAQRRERTLVAGTIVLLIGLSAIYTFAGVGMEMSALEMTIVGDMGGMAMGATGGMEMAALGAWSAAKFVLIFLMWWVMMIAMMLPSAAPTVLLYTALLKRGDPEAPTPLPANIFMASYFLVWAGFSVAAMAAQWGLEAAGIVSSSMLMLFSGTVGALVLIAAGAYQFSPLKNQCLTHCRTPADFIAHYHRPGIWGAVRIGVIHGAFCLGCCFGLMALLFVGGIMNLFWIICLAALVAVEKLSRRGRLIGRLVGAGLIVSGMLNLIASS